MRTNDIIFVALFAGFILLVLSIRYLPFATPHANNPTYYKIDLEGKKITAIKFDEFKKETNKLFDNGYELTDLTALKAFFRNEIKFPERLFVVASNHSFIQYIDNAIPIFSDEKINIIIFIPIFIVANNNRYQHLQHLIHKYFQPKK